MKKLMIAGVAGLFAAVSFGELASANTVGYNTVNVKGGQMNLLCVSFETVGNVNGKATLNDVINTTQLTSCDENGVNGDYINTWNMSIGNWGAAYQYINASAGWGEGYEDTWMSNDEPCDTVIHAGTGFWYYAVGDNTTFTFTAQK
jgi:hypothetical protein